MKKYKNTLGLLVMVCSMVSIGFKSQFAHAMVNGTSVATQVSVVLIPDTVTAKSSVDSIKILQAALNETLGSRLKIPVTVDGKWGAKTTSTIKMFQSWAGLKPTGQVDLDTSTQLNISILTQ
jgi:peptidoglycan hydrolase-like protein with peptidoglycan-binding domain